uniref:RNA-binding cell elongation regulator Jag/EloR n=1 Tax=Eubacterium cellulosolvens TaxID=29322 RepID=UPI000485C972|nr:RNA-binding cell elongation regulator Jag/EloR [[Eubacterium] cellulosolvens]
MDFLEVSAKTVDDAITKACIDLGLSSDQLDIQVISEGSTGFLGLGSKPAVIQVRKKEIPEEKPEIKTEEKKAEKSAKAPKEKPTPSREKKEEKTEKAEKPAKKDVKVAAAEADFEGKAPKKEAVAERTDEEIVSMKAAASSFLEGVFKAMDLPVSITMTYNKEDGSLDIDFDGEDMGILIGKRGQTLDSLQYLVSLVVNRDQKNYVRVKLDTEDYRRRRRETLENLAKNIAYKVRRSRRSVSLEAMNPYERRIIHSALQNNKYVETHSEGNEPYRHVVVTAKKG